MIVAKNDLDAFFLWLIGQGEFISSCADSIRKFLDRGGVLVRGIVPTGFETFGAESLGFLAMKMDGIWKHLSTKGLDIEYIISRSMLSPATCCLVNPDKGVTVEKAFALTNQLSHMLREKYKML